MCWPLRRHQQSRTSSSRWFPNSVTGSSPQATCTTRGFAALVRCCHRLTMVRMSSDRYSIVEVIEPNQEIHERLVVVRDPRGSVAGITDMAQKLDGFKYVDDLPQDLASALKDPKRYVGIQPRAWAVATCAASRTRHGLTCRRPQVGRAALPDRARLRLQLPVCVRAAPRCEC